MATVLEVTRNATSYSSGTVFFPLADSFVANNTTFFAAQTEANAQVLRTTPGTFSNLRVNFPTNTASTTLTVAIRVNGANGNETLSIGPGLTGMFQDSSNTDTISSGDLVDVSLTRSAGTGSYLPACFSISFTSGTGTCKSFCSYNGSGGTSGGANGWVPLAGAAMALDSVGESAVQTKFASSATLQNLSVYVPTNTSVASGSVTSRLGGVNSALAVTIGGGLTGRFSDLSHSINVVSGNLYCYAESLGDSATAIRIQSITTEAVTTDNSFYMISGTSSPQSLGPGLTRYYALGGGISGATSSTESDANVEANVSFILSRATVVVAVNSLTAASTWALRINNLIANQSATIGSGLTGKFTDSANSDVINAIDLVDYQLVSGGTGTLIYLSASSVLATVPQGITAGSLSPQFLFSDTGQFHLGSPSDTSPWLFFVGSMTTDVRARGTLTLITYAAVFTPFLSNQIRVAGKNLLAVEPRSAATVSRASAKTLSSTQSGFIGSSLKTFSTIILSGVNTLSATASKVCTKGLAARAIVFAGTVVKSFNKSLATLERLFSGTVVLAHNVIFAITAFMALATANALKQTAKPNTAITGTFSGVVAKLCTKVISSLKSALAATIVRLQQKVIPAFEQTWTTAQARSVNKGIIAGTASSTATALKKVNKFSIAVESIFSGILTTTNTRFAAVTASLVALAAGVVKQTGKANSSAQRLFSGVSVKLLSKALQSVASSLAAVAIKTVNKTVTAAENTWATVQVKTSVKNLLATSTVSGSISKAISKSIAASEEVLSGILAITKTTLYTLVASMAVMASSIVKQTQKTSTAIEGTFNTSNIKSVSHVLLANTQISTGGVGKSTSKGSRASLSLFDGFVSGLMSLMYNITASFGGFGAITLKQTVKINVGVLSSKATVAKLVAKGINSTQTVCNGVIDTTRIVVQAILASMTTLAGQVSKQADKTVFGSMTFVASSARNTARQISSNAGAMGGSTVKAVSFLVSGITTVLSGSVAYSLTHLMVLLGRMTGWTGQVPKTIQKQLLGSTQTQRGTTAKAIASLITAVLNFQGVLGRGSSQIFQIAAGMVQFAGYTMRVAQKEAEANSTPLNATIVRGIQKYLSALSESNQVQFGRLIKKVITGVWGQWSGFIRSLKQIVKVAGPVRKLIPIDGWIRENQILDANPRMLAVCVAYARQNQLLDAEPRKLQTLTAYPDKLQEME